MKHLIVLLLAAMLVACNNQPANQPPTKPQPKKEVPVNGVDISHHNTVQWDSLKTCNISFVYIKASEGKTYKDPKRVENYKMAKKHYSVGFYVFWDKDISGKDHFDNFVEATKDCPADLPPALDLEFHMREKGVLPKVVKEVEVFTKLYMEKYKVKPIIYADYDVAQNVHKLNPTFQYWVNAGNKNRWNPHGKAKANPCDQVPWVILQCGAWNFGTGDIDLNYGELERIKKS